MVMLSVFFFGNPLVSGLVLESGGLLKMQATSFSLHDNAALFHTHQIGKNEGA